MSFTEKDLRHIARLAALQLTDEELSSLQAELNNILEYVNTLSTVPTEGVEPTSHVHGVVNVFRDDILKDSLSLEQVQRNAPDFVGGFRVPKVI